MKEALTTNESRRDRTGRRRQARQGKAREEEVITSEIGRIRLNTEYGMAMAMAVGRQAGRQAGRQTGRQTDRPLSCLVVWAAFVVEHTYAAWMGTYCGTYIYFYIRFAFFTLSCVEASSCLFVCLTVCLFVCLLAGRGERRNSSSRRRRCGIVPP
ncbi:hypothetical protein BKA81DRAFT_195601 [Phyllosticta paracitricarpa]